MSKRLDEIMERHAQAMKYRNSLPQSVLDSLADIPRTVAVTRSLGEQLVEARKADGMFDGLFGKRRCSAR